MGSTSVLTNDLGDVLEETFYEPHGGIISGGTATKFQSEGKEFDDVTGSYDFHFRQYNPETTIFGQPDTLIERVYGPQTINRYSFERGNPLKYMDPDGHMLISFPHGKNISKALHFLKGRSAYLIFRNKEGSRLRYPKGHFWAQVGFASTVGCTDITTTSNYIQKKHIPN